MRKLGHQMHIISYHFPFGYLINEMAFLDFIPAGVVFNFPIYWFDVHGVIQRFNKLRHISRIDHMVFQMPRIDIKMAFLRREKKRQRGQTFG
jgi:hypothetical protein